MTIDRDANGSGWPVLLYAEGRETWATLHLWTQIIGKVRLALTPWVNHSWHATLYVTARGLTTGLVPAGGRGLAIDVDLVDQALVVRLSDGTEHRLALGPGSVAGFHDHLMAALDAAGVEVRIHAAPNEIPDAVPFRDDRAPRRYDPEQAVRFWRALVQIERVFQAFRTGFIGKVSPVHLFWGSFDLAVTRFSGRSAPPHPGGIPALPDDVTREAYSHEVSSAGFWPGGGPVDEPAFYAYAYPTPAAFARAPVHPEAAFFHDGAGEFILPYDAVRRAAAPDQTLLDFLETTYTAAADLGHWDRASLECPRGRAGVPRPLA